MMTEQERHRPYLIALFAAVAVQRMRFIPTTRLEQRLEAEEREDPDGAAIARRAFSKVMGIPEVEALQVTAHTGL